MCALYFGRRDAADLFKLFTGLPEDGQGSIRPTIDRDGALVLRNKRLVIVGTLVGCVLDLCCDVLMCVRIADWDLTRLITNVAQLHLFSEI